MSQQRARLCAALLVVGVGCGPNFFVLDGRPPAAPDPTKMRLVRAPFQGETGVFELRSDPGAAGPGQLLEVYHLAEEPVAQVQVDEDGGWPPLQLPITDTATVYVAARSRWRVPSVRVAVERGTWRASTTTPRVRALTDGPVALASSTALQNALWQRPTAIGDPVDDAALEALADEGRPWVIASADEWRFVRSRSWWSADRGEMVGMPARNQFAIAEDPDRGGVVIHGGGGTHVRLVPTVHYDGVRWSALETTNSPPPVLEGAAMARDRGRGVTVLFGGARDLDETSDLWELHGDEWRSYPAAGAIWPPAQRGHALAYHPGIGAVVLFGGTLADGSKTRDLWAWSSGEWTLLADANGSPAPGSPALLAYDRSLGGLVTIDDAGALWLWDGEWGSMSGEPLPSTGLAYDERLETLFAVDLTQLYRRVAGSWEAVGPELSRQAYGLIYLSTGERIARWDESRIGVSWSEWDGSSWVFRGVRPETPKNDGRAALVYDTRRRKPLLVAQDQNPPHHLEVWTWDGTAVVEIPRSSAAVAVDAGFAFDEAIGAIVAFGGSGNSSTRLFDDTWRAPTASNEEPPPLLNPAMAFHGPCRCVVMFGGKLDDGSVTNSLWALRAGGWEQVSTTADPPPRSAARAVNDPTRSAVVLFGGVDGSEVFADTWELAWDGASPAQWREVPSSLRPLGGARMAMVYDERRQAVVLVRAPQDGSAADTVWALQGDEWRNITPPGLGPAGFGFEAAYDRERGTTLLWTEGDAWELSAARSARPGLVASIDVLGAGVPLKRIDEVEVEVTAEASSPGEPGEDGAFELSLWHPESASWRSLGRFDAEPGSRSVGTARLDAASVEEALARGSRLHVRLGAAGAGDGLVPATLALHDLEVRITYRAPSLGAN